MPRKTVRVDIPIANPTKYTHLIEKLWDKHIAMGAGSPLHNNPLIDTAKFETLKDEVLQKRAQAEEMYDTAQALMQQARRAMGNDKGQNINTPDTLYFLLNNIRQYLLIKNIGAEESLSSWGFNVVVSTANVGAKKKKKV